EGTFRAYHQEGEDGHDTIEWVARQPWSNGRVGTFGLSYPGAVQWLAAMEAPPSLKAIFPAMTFATGRHFFHHGGALDHAWIPWIEMNIAPDERGRRGLPGPKIYREARARWREKKWEWEGYMPLVGFPRLQEIAPWYYEWLRHPDDGPFWAFADVQAAHGRITVPALNFSGWFDNNYGPLGAIANFNGMRQRAATEEARRGQKLILGPWDHGDPNEYETHVGELDFGINTTFDYFGLILRWHDRWLKGIQNGVDDWPPVQIFVMGENVWRAEEEWPPARAQYEPYYLRSGGAANGAGGDGRITTTPPPVGEPPDRYVYDPKIPVTYENFESTGPFDHAPIQARKDVLVYTSAPLDRDLEVTGPITADLWIASSAIDTDFGVTLLDVHPDGRAFNVMPNEAGYLRIRYRDSESNPTFITPGEPTAIRIGNMVTSNLFRKGHRIRVLITSSRFPVFDRNTNTGENPAEAVRMEPAQQTVFHDATRASRVTLPIIPRDGGG
ncbi:MAG: CocE/NonD family hydrolase, partial [Acidobacteria bacterium]|nr:CocE/NonD family hydrolase [Acidobacteriota bacterium]